MTDGPTGFHVAPITEDDMNRVTSILKRATDAIIGISQLSADVDMLRQTVSSLQADTERLRSQNNALDEALNYSRGERDRQTSRINELQSENSKLEAENHDQMAKLDKQEMHLGQLEIDLDLTRKAKDDAEFHNLELEDKLKAMSEKLKTLEATFLKVFDNVHEKAMFEPEIAIANNVPPAPSKPEPVETHEATYMSPPEPTPPDSRSDWQPGYFWDHDTNKYWRQGLAPKSDGADIPY